MIFCVTGQQLFGINFMKKPAKEKIIKGRVSDSQYDKLMKHCEGLGITMSQWLRQRIDKMRVK